MIKNRFYKTTIGVPFELVTGNVARASTGVDPVPFATFNDFAAGGAVGDYEPFYDDGSGSLKGLTFGTALTAAQKKFPISISYIVEKSNGLGTVVTPTALIGETIKAQLVAYAAPTFQDAKIVRQSGTVQLTQELALKIVETTPLNDRLPSYDYNAVVVTTFADALANLAAQINAAKEDEFFTAVAITDGIQIISKDANRHFRLAMTVIESQSQPYNDTSWLYTVTTPAFAGSGTVDQVKELLLESDIKRGVTTQYPNGGTAPSDFGTAENILDLSGATQFDVVLLTGIKYEDSPTPVEVHHNKALVFVVVPAGQGAAVAATFA